MPSMMEPEAVMRMPRMRRATLATNRRSDLPELPLTCLQSSLIASPLIHACGLNGHLMNKLNF